MNEWLDGLAQLYRGGSLIHGPQTMGATSVSIAIIGHRTGHNGIYGKRTTRLSSMGRNALPTTMWFAVAKSRRSGIEALRDPLRVGWFCLADRADHFKPSTAGPPCFVRNATPASCGQASWPLARLHQLTSQVEWYGKSCAQHKVPVRVTFTFKSLEIGMHAGVLYDFKRLREGGNWAHDLSTL